MNSFDAIWKIFKESFPEDERRNFKEQNDLLKESRYNLNPIYDGDEIIGFTAIWDFDDFTYVEHFAVKKDLRGKGYGSKIIKDVISKNDKLIILEVEKPETDEAIRRIEFYKRVGFHVNNYEYIQPPYDKDKQYVPLIIMSFPNKIDMSQFAKIREDLYKIVYKVKLNSDGGFILSEF
jgi:ribosomal protein S18 acetylase RimI-like enzyme